MTTEQQKQKRLFDIKTQHYEAKSWQIQPITQIKTI